MKQINMVQERRTDEEGGEEEGRRKREGPPGSHYQYFECWRMERATVSPREVHLICLYHMLGCCLPPDTSLVPKYHGWSTQ